MREIRLKKRGTGSRKSKPTYMVITEGKNKTETQYIQSFQSREAGFRIRFVKAGNKTDPGNLLEIIQDRWIEYSLSGEDGDRAFILVDLDCDERKGTLVEELASQTDMRFIISNPCFEVWFHLHFSASMKPYPNSEAVKKALRQQKMIPEYEENMDVFGLLKGKMNQAIENAQKINVEYEKRQAKWPSTECNPRTDVVELVELFMT